MATFAGRDTGIPTTSSPLKIIFTLVVVGLFGLVGFVAYNALRPVLDNNPPVVLDGYMRGTGAPFSFAGDRTSVRLPGEAEVDAQRVSMAGRDLQGSAAQVTHKAYGFVFLEVDTPRLRRANAAQRRASIGGGLAGYARGQGFTVTRTGSTTVGGAPAVTMRGTYQGDQIAGSAVSVKGKTYFLVVRTKTGSAAVLKKFEESFVAR